jgi:uncharacterized membrane protein HdeD (DUF308 family)
MLALLLFPVPEAKFHLLGIKSDKWVHVALFGGFAMMLRWNVDSNRLATVIAVGITTLFAASIEVVQSFTTYRSAELADFIAGAIGAMLGVIVMNRILASSHPDRFAATFIVLLGMMIGVSSVLADVIGVHHRVHFGPVQMAGTVLGMLLVLGGIAVYRERPIGNR